MSADQQRAARIGQIARPARIEPEILECTRQSTPELPIKQPTPNEALSTRTNVTEAPVGNDDENVPIVETNGAGVGGLRSAVSTTAVSATIKCYNRGKAHPMSICADFKRMAVKTKWLRLRELRNCANCFSDKHTVEECLVNLLCLKGVQTAGPSTIEPYFVLI